MSGIERFRMRMKASGGSIRSERISDIQDTLSKTFKDDPAYYESIEVLNSHPINCRIYSTTPNSTGDDYLRIQAEINTKILIGDLVKWKSEWWMVTKQQNVHDMFWSGIIQKTNHLLKWVSNGSVIENYCIVKNGTKYTVGTKETDFSLTMGDTRVNITLPRTEENLSIPRGQRFLISNSSKVPRAYVLTSFDDISDYYADGGLINLICEETVISEEYDSSELMIADYYKYFPKTEPNPSPFLTPNCKIIDESLTYILRIGLPKTLRVNYYDDNGSGINLSTLWTVSSIDGETLNNVSILETDNSSITIRANNDYSFIGTKVKIQAMNKEKNYHDEIYLEIRSL